MNVANLDTFGTSGTVGAAGLTNTIPDVDANKMFAGLSVQMVITQYIMGMITKMEFMENKFFNMVTILIIMSMIMEVKTLLGRMMMTCALRLKGWLEKMISPNTSTLRLVKESNTQNIGYDLIFHHLGETRKETSMFRWSTSGVNQAKELEIDLVEDKIQMKFESRTITISIKTGSCRDHGELSLTVSSRLKSTEKLQDILKNFLDDLEKKYQGIFFKHTFYYEVACNHPVAKRIMLEIEPLMEKCRIGMRQSFDDGNMYSLFHVENREFKLGEMTVRVVGEHLRYSDVKKMDTVNMRPAFELLSNTMSKEQMKRCFEVWIDSINKVYSEKRSLGKTSTVQVFSLSVEALESLASSTKGNSDEKKISDDQMWKQVEVIKESLDNLVLDTKSQQTLTKFVEMRKRFSKRTSTFNVDVNPGFILVGPPGTGKSTMPRGMASNLGKDIYLMDMGKIDNLLVWKRIIRSIPSEAMVVMEEIDRALSTHELKRVHTEDKTDNSHWLIYALIEFFDSLKTKDTLVFATSNKEDMIECMDEALLRPGRFGCHLRLGLCDRSQFSSFYQKIMENDKDVVSKTELECFPENTYSPAEVIQIIAQNFWLDDDMSTLEDKIRKYFPMKDRKDDGDRSCSCQGACNCAGSSSHN